MSTLTDGYLHYLAVSLIPAVATYSLIPPFKCVSVEPLSLSAVMALVADIRAALGLIGKSGSYQNLESLVQAHSYLPNRTIVFNCNISFDSEILAHTILDPMKYSIVLPFANVAYGPDGVYNEAPPSPACLEHQREPTS